MAEKIRVGLVGYGYAGKTFHAPLIAGTPGLELAAVASSDAGKVHADWPSMAVVGDAQALFADPTLDLIVIPTPNDTHFRWRSRRWLRANTWWWINRLP